MTDRAIREAIVRLLLESNELISIPEVSEKLGISKIEAQSNMEQLAVSGCALQFCTNDPGECFLRCNFKTAGYLAVPDSATNETTINVSGNSNLVAGHNMQISNSTVLNTFGIPQALEEELEYLLEEIRNANSPKTEQESRVHSFLSKVATSCASSVVASCAVAIFKAAIGLP